MSTKVTFTLPAEVVADATSGIILGEFNNWDNTHATNLKKQKDGSMIATVSLEAGRTYQYRYLLDNNRWVNDHTADNFIHVSGFHVENCVINVPVETHEVLAGANLTEELATDPGTNTSFKKDDLTKIEGIGKKIAELLIASGIATFGDLAKATPKKLKSILDAAGSKFKIHDPATWPKQSKLAAAGKWPELKKLQTGLKGGK